MKARGVTIGMLRYGCNTSRSRSPVTRHVGCAASRHSSNLLSFGSRQSVTDSFGCTNRAESARNVATRWISSGLSSNTGRASVDNNSSKSARERTTVSCASRIAVYIWEVIRPPVSALTNTFVSMTTSMRGLFARLLHNALNGLGREPLAFDGAAQLRDDLAQMSSGQPLGQSHLFIGSKMGHRVLQLSRLQLDRDFRHPAPPASCEYIMNVRSSTVRSVARLGAMAVIGLLIFWAIAPAAWAGTSDTWNGGHEK